MLRPPLRASPLGGGILEGGSVDIVAISLTRCPGHAINYLA